MPAIDVSVPQLLLQGAADTLSLSVYSDGVIADPGVTTVGVVDETGSVIIAAGTATSGSGAAGRTKTLTGSNTAALGRWTVTWVTTNHGTLTTYAEVVGAHLFTIAEAIAFAKGAMATAGLTAAQIAAQRFAVMEDFESITGASFVPRWHRVVLDGSGNCRVFLPQLRILSLIAIEERTRGTQTWTAFTEAQLDDTLIHRTGAIERESLGTFTAGTQNIRVTYSYGWASPPPMIREAALRAARHQGVYSPVNERAISISNEQGSTSLWTPGYSGRGSAIHPLPEVDRVLRQPQFMDRIPGLA